ncbi:glycosyltransferase N-terminal domain-containing protein [Massilibacteroides sp.]|uniref:3-deoxy-D-manno-octulosonic acid transferase n=1 Tax=Massilibacteroides sp. TaxID=2034766 RepID=UPI00261C8A01|nr:glycosyltransferase N-terminal domain-containing protein [Massilibacteroides sp.]MDD4516779.1 glycosyltransferase N-terminal domain-containing protein [Massilibacteroides sp.]
MIYSLIIHLYAFVVELITPFHKKARLIRLGQWKTNAILRDNIDRNAKYIWVHASSLGEFEQGRPVIEKIKAEHPEYKILLTFFSPSGYEVRKNYDGADVICYLPFDTPYRVKKFLNLANPTIAIFIKYEFWANYLTELKKRNIPTYIISAIFRPQQVFFKWYGRSYRKVLTCFNHLFVQDEASRALLAEYNIKNVTVAGDTRFDRVLDVQKKARIINVVQQFIDNRAGGKQTVLVAGSSWPQDEELFISYFNDHPEMKLIIAPHEIHKEHLLGIASLLKRKSVRLSEATSGETLEGVDCLIIDSFGLLSSIYRYGDIAYIGGGFGVGIHNILEAAVYGMPVVFGPKYQKFKEAKDLLQLGGAFSIANQEEFNKCMDELFSDSGLLQVSGKKADEYVRGNAGVTARIVKELPL